MACLPRCHPLSGVWPVCFPSSGPFSRLRGGSGFPPMANVVVVGPMGRRRQCKIVDCCPSSGRRRAFPGRAQRRHTLVIDGVTYKLSLLPSGRRRAADKPRSSATVSCSSRARTSKNRAAEGQGVAIRRTICASPRTCADPVAASGTGALRESSNSGTRIGTTKRGIGPAYEDKVGRRAIRLMDLADLGSLGEKIDGLLALNMRATRQWP